MILSDCCEIPENIRTAPAAPGMGSPEGFDYCCKCWEILPATR